jgi:hypothetical protein
MTKIMAMVITTGSSKDASYKRAIPKHRMALDIDRYLIRRVSI